MTQCAFEIVTIELEGSPAYKNKPTYISDVKAKVAAILSNRLGVLTTVLFNDRFLYDIEKLILAEDKCDPSYPLSFCVSIGRTELHSYALSCQQMMNGTFNMEQHKCGMVKRNCTSRFFAFICPVSVPQ
jgi:hypothetical protein